jgi:hypothetical protein
MFTSKHRQLYLSFYSLGHSLSLTDVVGMRNQSRIMRLAFILQIHQAIGVTLSPSRISLVCTQVQAVFSTGFKAISAKYGIKCGPKKNTSSHEARCESRDLR